MKCENPYFKSFEGLEYKLPMPCGHCYACRIKNASVWSLRMQLESTQWEQPLFLTLTYDDPHLPLHRSLVRSHPQLFFKLLRYYLPYKIKYWVCGEYGEKTDRPHYHAIVFGVKKEDEHFIAKAWKGRGSVHVAPAYTGSFYYVAGYVTKKLGLVRDWKAKNPNRQPPFMQCSQGMGLAFMMNLPFYTESLDIGGRRFAIGRYLKNKMADKFGILEIVKNKGIELLYDSMTETIDLWQSADPAELREYRSVPRTSRRLVFGRAFIEKSAYYWRYEGSIEAYKARQRLAKVRDYEPKARSNNDPNSGFYLRTG